MFCTALGLPLEMLKQKVKKTIGHLTGVVGGGEGGEVETFWLVRRVAVDGI